MNNPKKIIITFLILIAIIIGLYYTSSWISSTTGYSVMEQSKIELAQCLSMKKAKMYGMEDCMECQRQKELFSNAFQYINYTDCEENVRECQDLPGIPAWEIQGTIYFGVKTLEALKILSRC